MPTGEELEILGRKVTQLKLAYDQYFLGSRPREPVMLRDEVRKLILVYSNEAIQNTALRFKFNSISSRYQAFKRQWTETLRKIEEGTYSPHRFKAKLHGHEGSPPPPPPRRAGRSTAGGGRRIFDDYVSARQACGEDVEKLSPEKLEEILNRQREVLRERYGDCEFEFRVTVEDGRAKLKASRVK